MTKTLLVLACALLLLGAGAAVYARMPVPLPTPSGPFGIASQTLDLPTAQAGIATPDVEIWYPVDRDGGSSPRADSPSPVLIYLPGWGGTELDDIFLIRDLVSHGYVVASLRYLSVEESDAAKRQGITARTEAPGEMDFSSQEAADRTRALADSKVRARAENVVAVLDRLTRLNEDQASGFAHRLDLEHVGAWGFSLGGAAAAQAAWLDRRIKAASNLDGWLFADASADGVPCPYLLLGDSSPSPTPADLASSNPYTRYTAMLNVEDDRRQDAGLRRFGGFFVTIEGTEHTNFSDEATKSRLRRLTGAGAIDPARGLVIIASYLRAFFDHVLLDKPAPLLQGNPSAYPEVSIKIFEPSR